MAGGLRLGAWGIAAAALCAASPARQTPASPQSPAFRSGVDLVQLAVSVTDAGGRPVRGLTREDFRLLDDGRPATIAVVAEHRSDALFVPSEANLDGVRAGVAPDANELVALVVDDLHVRVDRADRAKDVARRLVDGLAADAASAVTLTSGHATFAFSLDRTAALEAVARLTGHETRFSRLNVSTSFVPQPPSMGPPPLPADDPEHETDDLRLLHAIRDAANAFPHSDGRKHAIVVISEGIAPLAWSSLVSPIAIDPSTSSGQIPSTGSRAATSGPVWLPDTLVTGRVKDATRVSSALVEALRAARLAGAAVYAIDPRGAAAPGAEGYFSRGAQFISDADVAENRQRSLALMTVETGGFPITDTDAIDAGVERILRELSDYYVLGFSPADRRTSKPRIIEVLVSRPGLTVRHRRLYENPSGRPVSNQTSPFQ
jgi:VWFA-related protein